MCPRRSWPCGGRPTAAPTGRLSREGLPSSNAFVGVLRESMARDDLQPFGLYFGTSTGQLFASADEGATWQRLVDLLPPITSVETALVDA